MKGDREAEGVNKPPAAQASLASLHFPLLLYPPSLPLKHTADEQGLEIALGEAMKTRIVTPNPNPAILSCLPRPVRDINAAAAAATFPLRGIGSGSGFCKSNANVLQLTVHPL